MSFFPVSSSVYPSCTKTVTIHLNEHNIKLKQGQELLVNGQEVSKLPITAAGAYIHSVSSIFLRGKLTLYNVWYMHLHLLIVSCVVQNPTTFRALVSFVAFHVFWCFFMSWSLSCKNAISQCHASVCPVCSVLLPVCCITTPVVLCLPPTPFLFSLTPAPHVCICTALISPVVLALFCTHMLHCFCSFW